MMNDIRKAFSDRNFGKLKGKKSENSAANSELCANDQLQP